MDQKAEQPKKKWYLRWWMIVIYVVLGLSFLGSLGSKGSSSSVSQGTQQTAPAPTPAISVTAFKMASDYKDNQVAADAKYKDKLVEISGTVDTIGKDALDTPFIAFQTESQYDIINRIQCMFGKNDIAALSNVVKGQKITLRGTDAGMLGNIIVNDCQIVQ